MFAPVKIEKIAVWRETEASPSPDVSFVPPLARRRLTDLEKAALAVANEVYPHGEEIPVVFASRWGEIGTTVKLARALWIVPVTLFLSWFVAEKEEGAKSKFKLKVPWFIPWFIAAAALVTWLPALLPAAGDTVGMLGGFIKNVSKYLLIVTLFLIGSNLSRSKLKELGIRPVLQGFLLWVILATVWCCAIHFGWVNCVK
jgi:uncharacterized membrane protein YadS